MQLRSLAENITRRWVLRRRLPSEFDRVPIYTSPSGGLRFLLRSMSASDPELLALAKEFARPGSVVWDVGANVGLFSVAAAQRAGSRGTIVSLEPDTWLVELLRRTAHAQRPTSARIHILPVAAASSVAIRSFCIGKRSRATNYLSDYGTAQTGGTREEHAVMTVTLDWLGSFYPAPQLLKIDVEGAELEVLHGARHLLEEARPIVLCEVGTMSAVDVTEVFHGLHYELYDGALPPHARTPLRIATWSTIGIPHA